ncbi:hypothetical protein [Acinetobacter rudis]|uniref:Uncharacterized protein n=1 Tax=Acinetobacter rudis CIP 110305 TaxID=421052 RepID=S3NHJ8_9GAMM|nr:hypothetical protein [Acinetobacter rudis]EPF73804.1 hypothetical protein F945_01963 [Acinetobacter rudis CIP 110305]
MSEKLLATITHKCSLTERSQLEAIAKARGVTLSELVRLNNQVCISAEFERIQILMSALGVTTDTRANDFELAPPLRDVTPPKTTGIKKAQLREQLSLIHAVDKQ